MAAARFNQPMNAFLVEKHPGALGREFSFGRINEENILVRALKKRRILMRSSSASMRALEKPTQSSVLSSAPALRLHGKSMPLRSQEKMAASCWRAVCCNLT